MSDFFCWPNVEIMSILFANKSSGSGYIAKFLYLKIWMPSIDIVRLPKSINRRFGLSMIRAHPITVPCSCIKRIALFKALKQKTFDTHDQTENS